MARVRISPKFRLLLSDKLMDLGNFIAIALPAGQIISNNGFSTNIFVIGLLVALLCYVISYTISR